MSTHTKLGPGTVSVKVGSATAKQFEGEVKSASISHEYESIGDSVTYLDGSTRGASERRIDGFSAELDNDLTAAGLYKYLIDNDLSEATLTYTPNMADAASWTGTVTLRLPSEVGAGEFGEMLASSVEWVATAPLVFTPAGGTP